MAGLPVGRNGLVWHDLRHEFVSYLVDQGGEIHEVKEAARHKDIRTTERYMKAREDRLKALMAKMADRGSA
jgi:site-specific recombinase XerD